MEMVEARDIDTCAVCDGLYFPGDDLIPTEEGLSHPYHRVEKTMPNSDENVVLKS